MHFHASELDDAMMAARTSNQSATKRFFGAIPRGEASSLVENVILRTFGEITFLVASQRLQSTQRIAPYTPVKDRKEIHALSPCHKRIGPEVALGRAPRNCLQIEGMLLEVCVLQNIRRHVRRVATLTLLLPQPELEGVMRPRRLQACGATTPSLETQSHTPHL